MYCPICILCTINVLSYLHTMYYRCTALSAYYVLQMQIDWRGKLPSLVACLGRAEVLEAWKHRTLLLSSTRTKPAYWFGQRAETKLLILSDTTHLRDTDSFALATLADGISNLHSVFLWKEGMISSLVKNKINGEFSQTICRSVSFHWECWLAGFRKCKERARKKASRKWRPEQGEDGVCTTEKQTSTLSGNDFHTHGRRRCHLYDRWQMRSVVDKSHVVLLLLNQVYFPFRVVVEAHFHWSPSVLASNGHPRVSLDLVSQSSRGQRHTSAGKDPSWRLRVWEAGWAITKESLWGAGAPKIPGCFVDRS